MVTHYSFVLQAKLLKLPQNWRPLLLVSSLIVIRELGGKISVFMYTVFVFLEANVSIDPFLCTVLVGLARLLSTIIGSLVIDKFGRKSLLISTTVICGTSILLAGGVLLSNQNYPGGKIIPLICVLIFCVFYSAGLGPIPWVLMGELLPTPIRSLGTSLSCICFSSSMFIMTNSFPTMLEFLGLGTCFIIFGAFNLLNGVIAYVFLPETKGCSLLELEMIFSGNKNSKLTTSQEKLAFKT